MYHDVLKRVLLASALFCAVAPARAADVTLTIESWRNDDLPIWQEKIIPAFEAKHPGIKLKFTPSAPPEYDAVLNSKLEAGSAGDLITCRPFEVSRSLYRKDHLVAVQGLEGMKNFGAIAKAGWSIKDRAVTHCMPVASVIHGFLYNKDAFAKLGAKVPKTQAEFTALLDKIEKDGTYIPMTMSTNNDQQDYVGDFAYPDGENLFTLGRSAIYPAGSWDISGFNTKAQFKMGVFPPPVRKAGDVCYISVHPEIAIGMNAKTRNPEAAKAFLNWVGSAEFADLYANALPGFFSLSDHKVTVKDPVAQEFLSWRGKCKLTLRTTYQISAGEIPDFKIDDSFYAAPNVIKAPRRLRRGRLPAKGPRKQE